MHCDHNYKHRKTDMVGRAYLCASVTAARLGLKPCAGVGMAGGVASVMPLGPPVQTTAQAWLWCRGCLTIQIT